MTGADITGADIIAIIILAALSIAIVVYLLHWLYRRSSKEVSFVRTGLSGEKVVLSGGAFVLPIVHNITSVGMRTLRIEVKRGGDKSIITKNRIESGLFDKKDFLIFVVLAFVGNVIGYGTSAFLDTILYAEPFTKVFTQLCIIAAGNTILIAIVGYFILTNLAKRKQQSTNLTEAP